MNAKYFAIVVAFGIFISVIEMIRRQKMTFKYSLSWLSASLLVLIFGFNDQVLGHLAKATGFNLTSNFIFFLVLSFFVYLTLLLTIYINEQNSRSEALAQAVGILEYKLEKLQGSKK